MSQFDFGTIDPNSKSGPQLALDLNKFRDALNSSHRGSARPAYAQAGMQWVRETSSTQWDLMFFDGDTDFVLRSVNPTTNTLIGMPTSQIQGLDAALALSISKDSALTTGAAILPSGTQAQRPGAPLNGMLRYNKTTDEFEGYQAGAWTSIISNDPWALQPIGVPIPVFSHLAGVSDPPKNKSYRYIKLSASDAYNSGVLVSESVSGSAPLVLATAVIDLLGSPISGRTVNLINTERRALRAGASGTVEADAMQVISGTLAGRGYVTAGVNGSVLSGSGAFSVSAKAGVSSPSLGTLGGSNANADTATFDSSAVARTAAETRSKNIGVDYFMRVK